VNKINREEGRRSYRKKRNRSITKDRRTGSTKREEDEKLRDMNFEK